MRQARKCVEAAVLSLEVRMLRSGECVCPHTSSPTHSHTLVTLIPHLGKHQAVVPAVTELAAQLPAAQEGLATLLSRLMSMQQAGQSKSMYLGEHETFYKRIQPFASASIHVNCQQNLLQRILLRHLSCPVLHVHIYFLYFICLRLDSSLNQSPQLLC
jgi:hypothetical protein